MIDLVALRSLSELAKSTSMAAVADSLGFTASAVSQQINRLETQLGLPLTEQQGRGVVLSAHGLALAQHAQAVFDAISSAEAAAHDATKTISGRFRIGGFATACRQLLIPAMKELSKQLDVTLKEQDAGPCIRAVTSGSIELGVIQSWDRAATNLPAALSSQSLGFDRVRILCSQDSPLAQRDEVDTDELYQQSWAIQEYGDGCREMGDGCREMFEQIFSDFRRLPKVLAELNEYESQVALARQGLVCAVIPELAMTTAPPGTALVKLANPPTRELFMLWRTSATNSAALSHVRESLLRSRQIFLHPRNSR